MQATELFQSGNLAEAVAAATESVKSKPNDVSMRSFLAELLSFAGDFDRADKQLDALSTLRVEVAVGVALFRQLLRAEQWRTQCFTEGRLPEFVDQPSEELQLRLKAIVYLREGSHREAAEVLAQAESARRQPSGTCNGQPFSDLRDLDDVLGSVVEILSSNGKYFWVPTEKIQSLELHPLRHARDQLWRGARIEVEGKIEGEIYLPMLYPLSSESSDDKVRLGRTTDWASPCEGIVRGQGQKMWLVGDDAIPVLQLQTIEFDR